MKNKFDVLKPVYSLKNTCIYLLISFLIVGIDQVTKILTIKYLMPIGDFPLIKGVLHLTYVENRGAAFGMMSDRRWIFMIASVLAIVFVLLYIIFYGKTLTPLLGISLSFVVGGGVGNMIDRVAYGYVVDFINFELIDFAVFNGADSFICIGAGLMILYVIISEFKTSDKKVK